MRTTVYDSRSEPTEIAVVKLASNSELPVPLLKELVGRTGIVEEYRPEVETDLPKDLQPALVGHFIIRNDVLLSLENFLTLLKTAAKLAVGIAGFEGLAGKAAVIESLHAIYTAYRGIVAQGFVLSAEELAVVAVLRDLGTATTDQIATRMTSPVEPPAIVAILARFERTTAQPTGFTTRDDNGFWNIVGI